MIAIIETTQYQISSGEISYGPLLMESVFAIKKQLSSKGPKIVRFHNESKR